MSFPMRNKTIQYPHHVFVPKAEDLPFDAKLTANFLFTSLL